MFYFIIYKAALALFPCGQKATFMTTARRETQSFALRRASGARRRHQRSSRQRKSPPSTLIMLSCRVVVARFNKSFIIFVACAHRWL